jgi:DNA-binding FadR family transcriptional regulator
VALQPVEKKSVSNAVFRQLLERLVTGVFPTNKPMPPERELCSMLGVSRTALREAMARLAQLGLVVVRQGGETTARDHLEHGGLDLLPQLALDPSGTPRNDWMRAAVEMRACLAPDIARLCAERATMVVESDLGVICDRMEAVTDARELQKLSLMFWSTLVRGSQNVAYRLAFNSLRDAYARMQDQVMVAMEKELLDLKGYRAIALAVKKRDPEAAEREARKHIQLGLAPMLKLFGGGGRTP